MYALTNFTKAQFISYERAKCYLIMNKNPWTFLFQFQLKYAYYSMLLNFTIIGGIIMSKIR